MLKKLRYEVAILACSLITTAGLATGVIASCDGNYCDVDTIGCTPLHNPFQDSCCRPSGSAHRCYTCWRDIYWCSGGAMAGPAYNCSNAGAICS